MRSLLGPDTGAGRVGKAKSLRSRVSSYFARGLAARTQAMVDVDSVEWIITDNEVEALMLEYSLIKRHRPRFNVRLVDDKSYPYLAITRSDEWPRARVMRGKKRKGTEYFGPYAHAYAIRACCGEWGSSDARASVRTFVRSSSRCQLQDFSMWACPFPRTVWALLRIVDDPDNHGVVVGGS